MEGRQGDEAPYRLHHVVVDDGRFPKDFSPVDHAMANAEKLGIVLNDFVLAIHIGHELKRLPVVGQMLQIDIFLKRSVDIAPTLTQSAFTSPNFSTSPVASIVQSGRLKTSYLMDELPQLMTAIFMMSPLQTGPGWR